MFGVPLPLPYFSDDSEQKDQLLLIFLIEMVQMLAINVQNSYDFVIHEDRDHDL